MRLPRNACLCLGWILGATLTSVAVAQAFPPGSPAPRSDLDPLSLSTLAMTTRPKIAVLRASLERNPHHADLLVELGEEYERIGDLRRALAAYDDALRARPDHPRAFYGFWQVRLSARARQTEAAAEASGRTLAAALKTSPGSETGCGGAAAHNDLFAGRVDEGRTSPEGSPDDPQTRIRRGLALLGRGQVDAAIDQYRAALAGHPSHAGARLQLARALMLRRQWHQARGHLEQLVRLRPDLARAHYALGLVRYTLNDLPGSIEAYADAVRADPSETQAHFQLGLLLRLNGQAEEAFIHLLEAARCGIPQAQYLVGTAYRSGQGVSRDLGQAVVWWFRAAGRGLPAARERLARFRLAALRGPRTEPVQAAFRVYRDTLWADYPELTRSRPEDSLGLRLLQLGRVQEALPILIQEAAALSRRAHRVLEVLYEVGVEGALEAYDGRILEFFEETAAEGLARSKIVLGRIYVEGLGVAADPVRARQLLASSRRAGVPGPIAWGPDRATRPERRPPRVPASAGGPSDPAVSR